MSFWQKVGNYLKGSWVGDTWDRLTGESDREFQQRQAQKQMDFQERMSNTALQRHVADAKSAGINPAFGIAHGGASSPSGSQADVGSVAQQGMFNLLNTAIKGLQKTSDQQAKMSMHKDNLMAKKEMHEDNLMAKKEMHEDYLMFRDWQRRIHERGAKTRA